MTKDKTNPLVQLSTKVPALSLEAFKQESKKFKSQGEFFTHLLTLYQNPPQDGEGKEIIKEVPTLPESLKEFVEEFNSEEECITALIKNFRNPKVVEKEVEKEVIKEVEKIVEKEVIKEIPVALGENQVVFTFLPEVQKNARKVRPFMLHDRVLTKKTPHEQIDEFLNYAAKYFMRHKYDHVINPL